MKNDKSVFDFLNPSLNDNISHLKGSDLVEFIILLNKYYLELRDKLNIDEDITFGIELEFERSNKKEIKNKLCENNIFPNWKLVIEATLISTQGAEVNSPILKDEPKTWKELCDVCNILKNYSLIGPRSAGHIHMGAHYIGDNKTAWLNLIKLWATYENVICRFCYGEYLTHRSTFNYYSSLGASDFLNIYDHLKNNNIDIIQYFQNIFDKKFYTLSLRYVRNLNEFGLKNTIEFRAPNGTLNPIVCQNNINLFANILKYCKSDKFNEDIINNRMNIVNKYFNDIDCYSEIFIDQALELSDMIFDTNLDKIYFLRQYLKSYEVGNYIFEKAKPFTLSI